VANVTQWRHDLKRPRDKDQGHSFGTNQSSYTTYRLAMVTFALANIHTSQNSKRRNYT